MKPRTADSAASPRTEDTTLNEPSQKTIAKVQTQRLHRVLSAWLALMFMMSTFYYHDHLATDEEGRAEYHIQDGWDRATASVLYAVSTGCSGGFGHLSSDWIGSLFILASVPLTAWLGGEVSMYRKALRDLNGEGEASPPRSSQ